MRRFVSRPNLSGPELEPLLEDISHCIHELRVIIDNAKPSVLQLFGFAQAVEAMLERSVGSSVSPLSYGLTDRSAGAFDRLPPNTTVALYRIVQEAINNAVRHAQANRLTVLMDKNDGLARIVIEDDGVGLEDGKGRKTGGLFNMSTRASLIQAEFRAMSGENGGGTRLEFSVLLPDAMQVPVTETAEVEL
jgi:signal transduction histidine kinase